LANRQYFCARTTHHTYSVGGRLAEYGLLVMDEDSTPPATAKQLARWMVSKERQYDSIQEIVRDALQDQRFEMLKALEVGQHPPVDRREYWIHRYASELARLVWTIGGAAIVNHARYAQS